MEITLVSSQVVINSNGWVDSYPKDNIRFEITGSTIIIYNKDAVIQRIANYSVVTNPSSTSASDLFNKLNMLK